MAASAAAPSRRDLLALLAATFGAARPAFGAGDAFAEHARAIGEAVLRSDALEISGDGPTWALIAEADTALDLVQNVLWRAAREDFRKGRTLRVDGVVLSRTEAEAYAFFALSHGGRSAHSGGGRAQVEGDAMRKRLRFTPHVVDS